MYVTVKGGTNAGNRRVRQAHRQTWVCSCGQVNKPNWCNCWSCQSKREGS